MQRDGQGLPTGICVKSHPVITGARCAIFRTVAMTLAAVGIVHATASNARAEKYPEPEPQAKPVAGNQQGSDPDVVGKRLEAEGNRLKAAVAKGEMTEEKAWAEWYAVKEQIITEAIESGELSDAQAEGFRHEIHKAELNERLGAAGGRIKEAAAAGEMTEEEAWAAWHAAKEELITEAVRSGEISGEEADAYRYEIRKTEVGDRLGKAGERIKAAAEKGEMTEEEAWAEWYATKEELISDAVDAGELTDADAQEFHREIHKAELGERLGAAGERIKAAAENGEMTEEEAWSEWHATSEELIAGAVEAGEVSGAVAAVFRRGLERMEAGERLKAAVARGEMTEEEAWAEWAEIKKQQANRNAEPSDRNEGPAGAASEGGVGRSPTAVPDGKDVPDDEWARYVRAFIARYQLTERQQRRAWRFYQIYRNARDRAEKSAVRLERRLKNKDDAQAQVQRESAREKLERDRHRLFERLKARLEKLPTRAQRQDAKGKQDEKP